MTEENIESKAKSFTTRVPADMWDKIEEYKKYGNWNTNQLMNHALTAFFDIVEDKEENPELPLVCETLRELSRKTRSRLMHSSTQEAPQTKVVTSPKADVGASQLVEQRGFACVGIAHDGSGRHGYAATLLTAHGTLTNHLNEFTFR